MRCAEAFAAARADAAMTLDPDDDRFDGGQINGIVGINLRLIRQRQTMRTSAGERLDFVVRIFGQSARYARPPRP